MCPFCLEDKRSPSLSRQTAEVKQDTVHEKENKEDHKDQTSSQTNEGGEERCAPISCCLGYGGPARRYLMLSQMELLLDDNGRSSFSYYRIVPHRLSTQDWGAKNSKVNHFAFPLHKSCKYRFQPISLSVFARKLEYIFAAPVHVEVIILGLILILFGH